MNKKVYFAGSIRGGRADEQLYRRMISHIQQTDTVLTEHVGNLELSKLEKPFINDQHHNDAKTDALIYQQDTRWLKACDIVIAECSTPSLGVGYELAFAERIGKPCHLLYNKVRGSLSAMLAGNTYFHLHPYEKEEDLYSIIDNILKTNN